MNIYRTWIDYAKNNEQNRAFLEHLVRSRNNGEMDEKMLESFCNAGIIGSPPSEGINFFEEFLNETGITMEMLGYENTDYMLNKFWDGFIIPSWGTGFNFLFCINHNKERVNGLEAKYINLYPQDKKEILSNFKFYGLENTKQALEKGYMCVCEGIFDKIRLEAEGLPAMTTLGSQISQTQLRILNRFDKIKSIGDNDLAGKKAQEKIMKGMRRTQQYKIPYEKDIDDLAKNRPKLFEEFIKQVKI